MTKAYIMAYNSAVDLVKDGASFPTLEQVTHGEYPNKKSFTNRQIKDMKTAIMDVYHEQRSLYLSAHPHHARICTTASEAEAMRVWLAEGGSEYIKNLTHIGA